MCIDSTRDGDLYKQYNTAKKLKLTESAIFMAQKIIYYKLRKLTFDRFNVFIFFVLIEMKCKKKIIWFSAIIDGCLETSEPCNQCHECMTNNYVQFFPMQSERDRDRCVQRPKIMQTAS